MKKRLRDLMPSFALAARLCCPQGTQPPWLEDRDEEQSEVPIIQEEIVAYSST